MACSQEFEHGVFVTESSQQRKRELGPGEWLKGHFRYGCFDFGCVNLFVLFNWVGCRRISVLSRPLVRCSACRACGIRQAARSVTIASRDGTSADRSPASASHWRCSEFGNFLIMLRRLPAFDKSAHSHRQLGARLHLGRK